MFSKITKAVQLPHNANSSVTFIQILSSEIYKSVYFLAIMTLPLCEKKQIHVTETVTYRPCLNVILDNNNTLSHNVHHTIAYITVSTVTVSESICDIGSNMPHLALLSVLAMRHKTTVKSHELILSY